ncbi:MULTISPECIES: hypothetical protein [Filomicrobium]|uniref:Anti-sigma factor n=1 Tax=Filomicrobium insigne TaxID=418854 RepID=A0A1H0Q5Z0_9HYPH|nr:MULTISPECIES: hypothetical protein [Filomicrobium]MCV0369795.1 hypothetical protein [Filomicrobium sp.]SDP12039.1 hypothetical protein SAMN04488061_2241 [Filomicrobium insigne]
MTSQRIGIETLSAYVDGELTPAEAADVARAAARDRAIAAQIASLREMKAAIADLAPTVTLRMPEKPKRWPFALPAMAAAASLAAVLILAVVLSGHFDPKPGTPLTALFETHHRDWTFDRSAPAGGLARVDYAGSQPEMLDLTAAQLAFAGRESFVYDGRILDRLGYEGTRGCRLSLFKIPQGVEITANAFAPPLHARVWTSGGNSFLLMAQGMAPRRFRELATVIESAIRSQRPFDAKTRQRLAQARAASRPCQA